MEFGPGTDLIGPLERLAHVEALLPEICTLTAAPSTSATATPSTSPPPRNCAPVPSALPSWA
jgi:hypothetical protein